MFQFSSFRTAANQNEKSPQYVQKTYFSCYEAGGLIGRCPYNGIFCFNAIDQEFITYYFNQLVHFCLEFQLQKKRHHQNASVHQFHPTCLE